MIYEIEDKSDNLLDILVQTHKFIDFTEAKTPLAFKMSALRKQSQIIPLSELKYSLEEDDVFISMLAEEVTIEYR